jgi:hypothetical protein
MKKLLLLLMVVLLVRVGMVVAGCQDSGDGIDHAAVQKAQAPLKAAVKRTGGDWSKLTPEERQLFLDRARGNEQSAKMMFGMFANGPPVGAPKH